MKSSEKRMSPSLSFILGTLFGAIAVFVPLASAGHTGSTASAPRRPLVSGGGVEASAPGSPKEKAREASNRDQCEVQLD